MQLDVVHRADFHHLFLRVNCISREATVLKLYKCHDTHAMTNVVGEIVHVNNNGRVGL